MARKKKEAESVEEIHEAIPETPGKPNVWNKKIKVTLEQLSQIEKDGKLVGFYHENGEIIALVR